MIKYQYILSLVLAFSTTANSNPSSDNSSTSTTYRDHFITGADFCQKYSDVTSKENGFYVSVPIDYANLARGTTKIWAYFVSGPYDAAKPTMVFFDGGSGGNTHGSEAMLKNFNELHYDQRGIGCSHPDNLSLYLDPSFYSNENNAKDANEIRKSLNISKISLFGGSYGTIVATIFASMYPQFTKAVVLDGTAFSGDENRNTVINYYLKKIYSKLSNGTKATMKQYFNSQDKIASLWMLTRILMYSENPFSQLQKYLEAAFSSGLNKDIADKLFDPQLFNNIFFDDAINGVEAFNNEMLNCKNMLHKKTDDILLYGSIDGQFLELQPYSNNGDMTAECKEIGVTDNVVYRATNYPISVPVTYTQGTVDSATIPEGAIKHYKMVPTGQKQILIAVDGGHCPGAAELMKKNAGAVVAMEAALNGQIITSTMLQQMNSDATVVWKYAAPKGQNH